MPQFRLLSFLSVAAFGMGLSSQMGATTVGVGVSAPASFSATTFLAGDGTSGPGAWTFTGGSSTANASNAQALDPFGAGSSTYFAYAASGGAVTANFVSGIAGLDVLWGSPDGYNKITFYTGVNATGTAESFVPGTAPLTAPSPVVAAPVLFVADPGVTWRSVVFSSTFDSFEFANVETVAAAPEPGCLALVLGGFVLTFAVRRAL